MSYYFRLQEEYEQIFKDRGYDEKSLNSPDRDGLLFKSLRYQLSLAIKNSVLDVEPKEFTLNAIGFFNHEKDMLIYKFHFSFNPEKKELRITQLDISDGKTKREIPLKSSYDLPRAEEGLKLLKDQAKVLQHRNARYTAVHESAPAQQHKRSL